MSAGHVLYRFFSSADELLYVGITCDPGRRFTKHREGREWWVDIARIEMAKYLSRIDVLAAEKAAIKAERPLHNVEHNGSRGGREKPIESRGLVCCGFEIGGVYAIGLSNPPDCPVAIISAGNEDSVIVNRMEFLMGEFDGGDEWIDADRVQHWLRAEEVTADRKRVKGYDPNLKVFETDPLGTFQTRWLDRPIGSAVGGAAFALDGELGA